MVSLTVNWIRLAPTALALAVVCAGCSGGSKQPEAAPPGSSTKGAGSTEAAPKETAKAAPVNTHVLPSFPAPPKNVAVDKIPGPKEKDWSATAMTPVALARKVADAVRGMKQVYGESYCMMVTPEGSARITLTYKIKDPKVYHVEFIEPNLIPSTGVVQADGVHRRTISISKKINRAESLMKPSSELSLSKAQFVQRWPREFSKLMFTGLTDGKDSWLPFVEGLASGGAFQTRVEERERTFNGHKLQYYRLVAKRNAKEAKKLGPCEVEMTIEARRFLPVTVRMISKDPKGKPWEIQWSTGWTFGQKFETKDIVPTN